MSDSYCNCAVDKFGFPDGWNFNEIWLDIVVILDTSEAMGENGLLEVSSGIGFTEFIFIFMPVLSLNRSLATVWTHTLTIPY